MWRPRTLIRAPRNDDSSGTSNASRTFAERSPGVNRVCVRSGARSREHIAPYRNPPAVGECVGEQRGLIEAAFALANRRKRHRNNRRAFRNHIRRPAEARDAFGHSARGARSSRGISARVRSRSRRRAEPSTPIARRARTAAAIRRTGSRGPLSDDRSEDKPDWAAARGATSTVCTSSRGRQSSWAARTQRRRAAAAGRASPPSVFRSARLSTSRRDRASRRTSARMRARPAPPAWRDRRPREVRARGTREPTVFRRGDT